MEVFVALTDKAWFDFLGSRAGDGGRLDEVNFWSPSSTRPLKALAAGDPVFFRLKAPHNVIVGYGFYAHFSVLSLDDAWAWFGEKNGDPDELRFLTRIGRYRGLDLLDRSSPRLPLGSTLLRDAHFWPPERWIPWGAEVDWRPNIVRGRTESVPARVARLLEGIQLDQETPDEFAGAFEPLEADDREVRIALARPRQGQGSFRARVLDAYHRRCAITGEHTEVVLDAAHIQPYLGPRSNHVQNGLVLTKDFHALYDRGYVTITPSYETRISPRLRHDFDNGHRYYPYDGERLAALPDAVHERPSAAALAWHSSRTFLD